MSQKRWIFKLDGKIIGSIDREGQPPLPVTFGSTKVLEVKEVGHTRPKLSNLPIDQPKTQVILRVTRVG